MINSFNYFSEREIMNDLLMSENQVASAYNSSITESTCPVLRNVLLQCFNNSQECQFEIINSLTQRGWYQVKEAEIGDIQSAKNKYSKLLSSLS